MTSYEGMINQSTMYVKFQNRAEVEVRNNRFSGLLMLKL